MLIGRRRTVVTVQPGPSSQFNPVPRANRIPQLLKLVVDRRSCQVNSPPNLRLREPLS